MRNTTNQWRLGLLLGSVALAVLLTPLLYVSSGAPSHAIVYSPVASDYENQLKALSDRLPVVERATEANPSIPSLSPPASVSVFTRETSGDSPDTAVVEEGLLVDGKREGKWRALFPNGAIWTERVYNNGNLEGRAITWDNYSRMQSGQEYKNGKLAGISVGWHANGQQAFEFSFMDGLREGPWKEWYDNGLLKAEGSSKNDKFDGKCLFYLMNGETDQKRSGVYSSGNKAADFP